MLRLLFSSPPHLERTSSSTSRPDDLSPRRPPARLPAWQPKTNSDGAARASPSDTWSRAATGDRAQLALRAGRDRPRRARRRRARLRRGEDPHQRSRSGIRSRRSPSAKLARLRRLAGAWCEAHPRRAAASASTPSRCSRRAPASRRSSTSRGCSDGGRAHPRRRPARARRRARRDRGRHRQRAARTSCSSACPTPRSARQAPGAVGDRQLRAATSRTARVTINLSPAALPKHGSGFDLGIALAVLAADRELSAGVGRPRRAPRRARARRAAAAVARRAALGARGAACGLRDGAWCPPATRTRRRSFPASGWSPSRACARRRSGTAPSSSRSRSSRSCRRRGRRADDDAATSPTSSATGMPSRRVQVAAAGGHHVFLLGPPGAGKTMLASRLPGLLPDLDADAALEVSSIRSLAGVPVGAGARAPGRRSRRRTTPRSPAAIVGGGSGVIRPGAAARAAHGVLFLDEAPEFAPAVARRAAAAARVGRHHDLTGPAATARFPARFQLVLAANPCPCGNAGARDTECTCTPFNPPPLPRQAQRPAARPRSTSSSTCRASRAAQLRMAGDGSRPPTQRRRAGAGRSTPARARPSGFARRPWRLNAHVPGSLAARRPEPRTPDRPPRSIARSNAAASPCAATTGCSASGLDPRRPRRRRSTRAEQIGRALYLRKAAT